MTRPTAGGHRPKPQGEAVAEFVTTVLADQIGPVAGLLVEESLADCGASTADLHRSRVFLVFLKALKDRLPQDIDRQTVYDQLWHRALARFTFV